MSRLSSIQLLDLLLEGERASLDRNMVAVKRAEAALWQEYRESSSQEQHRLPILDILEYLDLLQAKDCGQSAMTDRELRFYRESLVQDLSN
mgnify:CR=1 FL=1